MNPPAVVAVKLSKTAEKQIKAGHPWIFENSIEKANLVDKPAGSLCVIFDQRTNKPFAFGLLDPNEIIRIKIIDRANSLTVNEAYWKTKLIKAFEIRKPLLKSVTAFRALNGENDGFPGLVLDIYGQTAVIKIYSQIWQAYLNGLLSLIEKVFKTERIVIRFSRKLSDCSGFDFKEGDVKGEQLTDEKIEFKEYGVSFYAYPVSGHKTGFFLDQRPNRYRVQLDSKDKNVLDVFSYVGGFGIHALKGGAKTLTSIDISAQAMEVAEENMKLNHFDLKKWTPLAADAFTEMKRLIDENQKFDLVIIDPPSFAKQASEIQTALKQYQKLAVLGAKLTAKKGTLILGSCSSRVTAEDFMEAHQKAFFSVNENFRLIKEVYNDIDHPVNFQEAAYLKTFYYRRR